MDSPVWASNFARFGPQVIGRTIFDHGYPNWEQNPPFHAPVFAVTHRGQQRIDKSGGAANPTPPPAGGTSASTNTRTTVSPGQKQTFCVSSPLAQLQASAAPSGRSDFLPE